MLTLRSIGLRSALLLPFLLAACGGSSNGNGDGGNGGGAAPTVTSTTPAAGGMGIAINSSLTATFSAAMDPATLTTTTFTVQDGAAAAVAGTVTSTGATATFIPTNNLAASTSFTATVSTGAKDTQGNALAAPFTWTFTTGTTGVGAGFAPTVSSTNPAASGMDVALNAPISVTLSTDMDPTSITASTFTLAQGTTAVPGAVTYANSTAILTPSANLMASTTYTATLTTGAKDLLGNALAAPYSWTFTTGTGIAKGPAPVGLGAAGNFAVLAKTGISSVPMSSVTGDLGLSPAAATFVTGFSLVASPTNVFATSTQVVGKVYASNYAKPTPSNLTTSVSNMQAAYTDAAGRPTPDFSELGTGNIGSLTLVPGLYKWTSTVTVPTDTVISGGANDVWIFQTTGDLTMAGAKNITLAGGAQAKNIFWQVAGQATFGAGAHFEGILLCKTGVTLQTGATMNGRILSQTAVALQMATVTQPAQ